MTRTVLIRSQWIGPEGTTGNARLAFRSSGHRRGIMPRTEFAGAMTAPRSRIFATLVYLRQKSTSGLFQRLKSFFAGVAHDEQ